MNQPVIRKGFLTLPVSSQQWILLEEIGLSGTLKQLVALLTLGTNHLFKSLVYSCLIEARDKHLRALKATRCLLSPFLLPTGELNFLVGYDEENPLSLIARQCFRLALRITFVLQQDKYTSVQSILADTLKP